MNKMIKKLLVLTTTLTLTLGVVGCSNKKESEEQNRTSVLDKEYTQILEDAKGTTVNFYGYGGNEVMNKWFDTYVTKEMKEKYDITVNRVGMNIDEILNKLISEKQANSNKGTIDVVWLNGENFKVAKETGLLLGKFSQILPNFNEYVDASAPEINNDFGTEVEHMEAPWGRAQFVVAYDGETISTSITDHQSLMEVVKQNPGKFTYPALPDFTGSAFVRNIIYDVVGYENVKGLPLDKEKVREVIKPAMDYLNELKPYLWQQGENYPSTTSQLENMYSDKEVFATMTYSPNTLLGQIENGELPSTTKIAEFDKGNISNTHFLSIPFNSQNQNAAMVLIDFLLSIDSQASKTDSKNWGDRTVLDMDKIPSEEQSKFAKTIEIENTLPELPAGLVPIIEEIWTEDVLEGE